MDELELSLLQVFFLNVTMMLYVFLCSLRLQFNWSWHLFCRSRFSSFSSFTNCYNWSMWFMGTNELAVTNIPLMQCNRYLQILHLLGLHVISSKESIDFSHFYSINGVKTAEGISFSAIKFKKRFSNFTSQYSWFGILNFPLTQTQGS